MTSFPSLKQIFDNPEVAAAIIFCVSAGLGQVVHGVKKWAEGEVNCIAHWFTKDARRTVGAIIGNGASIFLFIQAAPLGPIYQVPNGWWALILFGFMNGFSADSALNKTTREQWTAEQRAASKP